MSVSGSRHARLPLLSNLTRGLLDECLLSLFLSVGPLVPPAGSTAALEPRRLIDVSHVTEQEDRDENTNVQLRKSQV